MIENVKREIAGVNKEILRKYALAHGDNVAKYRMVLLNLPQKLVHLNILSH